MAEHQQNQNYDYMVKLLIIGDSGVGKTCLLLRFCQNECPTTHLTTIGTQITIESTVNKGKQESTSKSRRSTWGIKRSR